MSYEINVELDFGNPSYTLSSIEGHQLCYINN